MTTTNMKVQLRRDTASNWTTKNPTLLSGEMGIETDTNKFKFGDGNKTWTQLDYASTESITPTWGGIVGTLGDQTDLNTALTAKVEKTTEFSVSESDTTIPVFDTLDNTWIYTNNGGIGDTAVLKTSSAYLTVRYNISDLTGKSVHVYLKWHSSDLPIPFIVFVTNNATIITRKLYNEYASSSNQRITVDENITVPEGATQLWIATTKADLPRPSAELVEPIIHTAGNTLDGIAADYINTVKTMDDIKIQPTDTYGTFFTIPNNVLTMQPASELYSTNEFPVTAGKLYTIKTEWQSGDLNTYIIAFTDNDRNVLLSKQYKQYGSGKVVVSTELEAPTNATKLFVSWRNEFNKSTCTEKAGSEYHLITLSEVIDNKISEAIIPPVDSSKSINMLFIGNSLTQDGVSYVPWILKRLYPEIQFKFWMWYCGGYQLYQHLAKFNKHQTCEIASYTDNTQTGWSNYNNSKTIDDMLGSGVKFDVISIQEYFTYKSTYGESDIQVFKDTLGYIADHYPYPYYLAELFHQPHLTQESKSIDIDDRFAWQVQCTQQMWNELPIQSIIPTGFASYRATKTDLNSLGDVGGLSPDYTHCQEGLPCQMLAWVTTQWILRHIGYPTGMYNDPTQINQSAYNSINVPGANIGSGLVTGTTAQYRLAQQVAMNALKECDSTFKFTAS